MQVRYATGEARCSSPSRWPPPCTTPSSPLSMKVETCALAHHDRFIGLLAWKPTVARRFDPPLTGVFRPVVSRTCSCHVRIGEIGYGATAYRMVGGKALYCSPSQNSVLFLPFLTFFYSPIFWTTLYLSRAFRLRLRSSHLPHSSPHLLCI